MASLIIKRSRKLRMFTGRWIINGWQSPLVFLFSARWSSMREGKTLSNRVHPDHLGLEQATGAQGLAFHAKHEGVSCDQPRRIYVKVFWFASLYVLFFTKQIKLPESPPFFSWFVDQLFFILCISNRV